MIVYRPLVLLAAIAALAGCTNAPQSNGSGGDSTFSDAGTNVTHAVNGSIHVAAGQQTDEVSTVNGSIHVDANAKLTAGHTVNGSIQLGAHAAADELNTVNGGITLDDGVHVARAVNTVNGGLTLRNGADVSGTLVNVNGRIELKAAHVGGGIRTVNADIDVGSNSRVEGGITVSKSDSPFSFFGWGGRKPKIVIGPGAVVQGPLRFERDVDLYVSDRATIGPVTGATPQKFSGEAPPS